MCDTAALGFFRFALFAEALASRGWVTLGALWVLARSNWPARLAAIRPLGNDCVEWFSSGWLDGQRWMEYAWSMDFDWDAKKDQQNREKHGLSFNEARELFVSGNDYIEIFDVHHSEDEERFIAIGPIVRGLIVVVWTERQEGVIRIISARPASKREIVLFRATMENTR